MNNDVKTGYPSIDKPWENFYTKEAPATPDPNCSMYEFLQKCNYNSMANTALNYYGKKITYDELFKNINRTANALHAIGVKQGDIVSVCPLNTPEFIYLLYAINKVGATSNWIGLTSPVSDLHTQLTSTKTRIIFTVNIAYDQISAAAKNSEVEKIITVPIEYSMPIHLKPILSYKNRKNNKQGTPWKEFIKQASYTIPTRSFKADEAAIIEYTGGSTGVPKGVVLSNTAINTHYIDFFITNYNDIFNFEATDRMISGVPFFLVFGMCACCHAPLCHGMELVLAPDPSPNVGVKIIQKYKINHVMAGRLLIEELLKATQKGKWNLSYIKSIMYGGEETNKVWENSIRNELKKYHLNAPILNSYGMSESSAGVLTAPDDDTDGLIPCAGVVVKIVNPENHCDEYSYDKEGELCVSTNQIMMGYFNHPADTQAVIFENNGVRWLKTHDLATISRDGIIKITGRIKRIYSKLTDDGIQVRVYPMRIEETLIRNELVQECAVLGIKDDLFAYRSVAYIVLTDQNMRSNDAKEMLQAYCKSNLPESHWPDEYVFVKSFPVTRAGKVDYRALEEIYKNCENAGQAS
ncbi:MAG: acyl--CoA ligase [Solobacterium sp.]|nr:acyl--CoA ligase [Solobacterium sp.]MBR3358642.1 acyl--CoA ligase [Solobacterium sp.]